MYVCALASLKTDNTLVSNRSPSALERINRSGTVMHDAVLGELGLNFLRKASCLFSLASRGFFEDKSSTSGLLKRI
jgi:hypothetical protein